MSEKCIVDLLRRLDILKGNTALQIVEGIGR
jgi:hypothetical protein